MKRILLLGKLNEVVKDIDNALAEFFHVQLCELKSDTLEGMLKVIEPELVIISLVGAHDYDEWIYSVLANRYGTVPVITVGTESEQKGFLRFYRSAQFEHLIRPVDNEDILKAVCRRLRLHLYVKGGKYVVSEMANKKNVLIVDDNAVTLRTLREMLMDDFEVSVATSGTQALTTIGKKRPDLILLDYEMPVCDGKQTLEMIRSDHEYKDIPVIFLTGISDKAHIEAVVKLKPQGYLLKPPSRDELIKTIYGKIN
ncbi:MAG: response regulator [Lachnospiraceae bacterium]|nr:response regulator [Lachnospiraceae bacterium]